jgi:hypothetical protein
MKWMMTNAASWYYMRGHRHVTQTELAGRVNTLWGAGTSVLLEHAAPPTHPKQSNNTVCFADIMGFFHFDKNTTIPGAWVSKAHFFEMDGSASQCR